MLVVTNRLVILGNVDAVRGHLGMIVWLLWLSLGQYCAMLGQSWAIFGGLGGYFGQFEGLGFRVLGLVVAALKT